MKTAILLMTLMFASVSWAQRKTYIMTPRGPVQVVTPKDLKKAEEAKKNQLKGVGQEFSTKADVNKEDKTVTAFVRGCGRIELGSQEAAEDASAEEKAKASKLKGLKNGTAIVVRMEAYGACAIKDWRKR